LKPQKREEKREGRDICISASQRFGFQDSRSQGEELHDIATPEIAKGEKPTSRKASISILGFGGRRGKALDYGIREIAKSGILK
jgi:hypothetical protein